MGVFINGDSLLQNVAHWVRFKVRDASVAIFKVKEFTILFLMREFDNQNTIL